MISSIHRIPFMLTFIRTKTFVKKPTKGYKRFLRLDHTKLEYPKTKPNQLENKFFKVVGDMKCYKNTSNGSRHRKHTTRFHLKKGPCIRRLSVGKRSTGGRNKSGQIVIRGRGGGHKRRTRTIDMTRTQPGPHKVLWLEYDPNGSADLCCLRNTMTNEFSYIIRPKEVNPGDVIESYSQGIPPPLPGADLVPTFKLMKPGNCFKLKDIPVGTHVHNIGLRKDGPAQLCRSAGTSGQILYNSKEGYCQIRLQSKEIRLIPVEAIATIGQVGNENFKHRVLGKAGVNRRLGKRPQVRGIAMSPYDHPHGGGGKSKGNKAPRSPWGWKCKGRKTVLKKKPLILVSVRKARLMKTK